MPRKYDSSRRRNAAKQTRDDILKAALRLHWVGITEYGPLAEEAGCSVATVRKHFPTKESLFQDCTRTFAESLTPPDLARLAGIASPRQRLEESVSELCRIHEAMLGYAWVSAHLRGESPTLDREMKGYEGLTDAVVEIVAAPGSTETADAPASAAASRRPVIRGLLDFLTYRALRLSGELTPDEACRELTTLLLPLVSEGDASKAQYSEEDRSP